MRATDPAPIGTSGSLRREWIAAIVVVVILVAIYATTLQPGVGGPGDAAKFQFLGWVLGTPHATGYPGYVMLNSAVTHAVPFGSVAVRANLLSAVLAAVACAVVFAALRLLGLSRLTAMAAALGVGVSVTVWSYSTIAEVYTLHLLFCALMVLFLLRWERHRRSRDLYLAIAVIAIAAGNHVTMVCWLPAVVVFIALVQRDLLTRPRFLACVIGFGVLGLLQYGYLVWRTFDLGTRYLEVTAIDLPDFLTVILGGRNQSNLLLQSAAQIVTDRVPWIAMALLRELFVFTPFVVIGLLRPLVRRDGLLLGAAAGNLVFVLLYTVPDLGAYLIPVVLVAMFYAAEGIQRVLEWPFWRRNRLLWIVLLMPVCLCLLNWRVADRRRARGPDSARSILDSSPDASLIVVPSYDLAMQLTYSILVERSGGQRVYPVTHQVFDAPFGFEEIRRYLCDGMPFRVAPRGRLISPDLPIVVAGARPYEHEILRTKGFRIEAIGRNVIQMTEPDCGRPRRPLAVMVHELEARRNLDGAIDALTDPAFDPKQRAVVIGRPGSRWPSPVEPAEVRVMEWSDRRAEFAVKSAEPGWLVVFDSFPSFWHAWVDGQPAPSLDVNVIHRGVPIPAGRHRVLLRESSGRFSLWRWLTGSHPPLSEVSGSHGE